MRKSLTDASSPIFGVKIKTYFKPPPSYPRWHFEPQNQRWTEDHFPCHLGDFCLVPAVNFQGCKKKTLPIHLGKWSYFTKLDFCQIRGIPYILRWNLTVMLGSQKNFDHRSIHPSIHRWTHPRSKPRKIRRFQVDDLHDSQKKWGDRWPGRLVWKHRLCTDKNSIGLRPGIPGRWVPRKIIDSKVLTGWEYVIVLLEGTLFETNIYISHLKIGDWKMTSLLERLCW